MKYITKNSNRTELFEAYREAKEEIIRLKRLHENSKEKKAKVIKNKNIKYDKLRYQVFKKDQFIWGKLKHIGHLQRMMHSRTVQAKKEGYEKAMTKVKRKNFEIISMYHFLHLVDKVTSIIGLSLNECSFLLWCGMFDFYNTEDFKRDCHELDISFYSMNNKMVKMGFVVELEKKDGVKKTFALTGTGLEMFKKINNFTKKHLTYNGKN
jgi:hypothetical protein